MYLYCLVNTMAHNKWQGSSIGWQYLDRMEGTETAKCKECKSILKCKGLSTSGLLRHERSAHNDTIPTINHEDRTTQKKRKTQTKSREGMEKIVYKLATVDGFSINAIVNSVFIRNTLAEKGMILPTNTKKPMLLM